MTTSTDPVSPEQTPRAAHALDSGDRPPVPIEELTLDLYAESELRHRQERTERMIRRAEEQLT